MNASQAVKMAFCTLTQGPELLEDVEAAHSQAGSMRALWSHWHSAENKLASFAEDYYLPSRCMNVTLHDSVLLSGPTGLGQC